MFHLPKFEKDAANVQYVHIPSFSISFRMPFEPLKTSALVRGAKGEEDPSEAQRQKISTTVRTLVFAK